LDIGQIDGVTFHQKLDCRPDDQERRNVDREYLKGFHGNLRGLQIRTLPQFFGRGGLSTAPDADVVVEVMRSRKSGVRSRCRLSSLGDEIGLGPIHRAEHVSLGLIGDLEEHSRLDLIRLGHR
jgi:hypothetical protein